MTDQELLERFEGVRLPAGSFDHEAHVRAAFLCLEAHGFINGLGRFRTGLKKFAMKAGVPEKYHETVTCALLVLIQDRMLQGRPDQDWPSFARENADLLVWKGGPFFDLYDEDILTDEVARKTFVLPRPNRIATSA